MYHVGEVVEVFSKSKEVISFDNSTQALLNMWDENLITVIVEEKITAKLKNGDIVLVDYRPLSSENNSPRMIVVKILRGDVARKTWRAYKIRLEELKGKREKSTAVQTPQRVQASPPTYIG